MKIRVMDFTESPGPRYQCQGKGSGEQFRENHLIPIFDEAVKKCEELIVNLDGAPFGYPTSFLEEAFGGLARKRGLRNVLDCIRITSTDEPALKSEIEHYIRYSEETKTPPFEISA